MSSKHSGGYFDSKHPENRFVGFPRRKFIAPALCSPYVQNDELLDRVCDKDAWRVCIVSTTPGYGKTSLLSYWYEKFTTEDDCCPLWMTLDSNDRSVSRFILGMYTLFGSVSDDFSDAANDLIHNFESVSIDTEDTKEPTKVDEEIALVDFVNLADDVLDDTKYYIVFLDGVEQATSLGFDETILYLNRFMGNNLRFIISGNYFSPRLDSILLESSILEFRTKDIRLSCEQERRLAKELMPELDECAVEDLCEEIGAWPEGYILAQLARRRAEDNDYQKLMYDYYHRFFQKNVMDKVDAATYEFLIETSFLEKLTPELCNYVLGNNQSKRILEDLTEHNLFLRYNVHSDSFIHQTLFRRFLIDRLLSFPPSMISRLASRASEWYAKHEMTCECARCLSIATDSFYIQDIIVKSLGLELDHSCSCFLEYLISQPAERFAEDEYLIWANVWSFIAAGFPKDARKWIQLAHERYPQNNQSIFDYANAICLALEGDSKTSLEIIRSVLENFSDDLPLEFRCLLIHMEGENTERLGDVNGARDLYNKSLSYAERTGGSFYRLFDYYLLAQLYLNLGNFEEALLIVERALPFCKTGSLIWGGFNAIRAFIKVEQGDVLEAEQLIERSANNMVANSNLDIYAYLHIVRARVEWTKGNQVKALGVINSTCDTLKDKNVPRNVNFEVSSYQAMYAAEVGDLSSMHLANAALDGFDNSADILRVMPCLLAKSRIAWELGKKEEAFAMLDRCCEKARSCSSTYYLAFASVFESRYCAESGDKTAAMIALNKAVELSLQWGYCSIFTDGGSVVCNMLFEIAANYKVPYAIRNYVKRILLLFNNEEGITESIALREGGTQGYYALTVREREILHLLNSGMSRKELTESLGVSQNTVKTHLKNIYSKLGVHTRSEAYRVSRDYDSIEEYEQSDDER